MKFTVNINWGASVVLTEAGASVLNRYIENEKYLTEEQKKLLFGKAYFNAGDTFCCVLWDMMRIFGDSLYHGCEIPFFENKVILDDAL
jgi:hypothetical protein